MESHHLDSSLAQIITHLAHLLPAQGPIGVFVHHNTLHAFQHLPFERAVVEAARIYGTEPYMREDTYRAELRRGRIHSDDIEQVLAAEPNPCILPRRLNRHGFRLRYLLNSQPLLTPESLLWQLEEGWLSRSNASLWDACLSRTPAPPEPEPLPPTRPRDGILAATGTDIDLVIHPLLIRLCGAFLDQGLAYWPMPMRERGFYRAVCALMAQPGAFHGEPFRNLPAECRRQIDAGFSPEGSLRDSLALFAIPPEEWQPALGAELLALPGWAGLFHRLEEEPQLAPHIPIPASLMDYLAVRFLLLRSAAGKQARSWRIPVPAKAESRIEAAVRLFNAAQAAGIDAAEISALGQPQFDALRAEVDSFDEIERRRLLHLAYERRHERQILLPLQTFRHTHPPPQPGITPAAQIFFCIDEREESIRRQLEEIDPEIETFGAAGFFGVAIDYTGIDDPHSVSLCPVVVTPQHAVRETVIEDHDLHGERRQALRKMWSKVARGGFIASRSLFRGWLATATLGAMSLFPLMARVLTPRGYAKLRQRLNDVIIPRPVTELAFTRTGDDRIDGMQQGFSVSEKADRVQAVLGGAGLINGFSRLVLVLGHGSTSLNNPHESAHDCGACGGRRGGPNGRLFAAIANRPAVREELARRGIVIPPECHFIGGYHDTCSDDIELYDLHQMPESHAPDLARVTASLDQARARNAHERARRFEFAHPGKSPENALHHVEERSEHLAEPRPEYGHCTNAVCVMGRRSSTRGLFFDRRAFLVSYDATIDPNDEYLAKQLAAVVPVCGGISLEYYFSYIDNEGYGCGTKLPHNVTGLMGVMNGHASDLRTGLPWQMVEIHEPVRILFVVETTPERLLRTIRANPAVNEFVENRWIRLSAMDPQSGMIHVYRGGRFELLEGELSELPQAGSSVDWYRGRMEHLPVARILTEAAAR
ncbi:MAG: DUF2309 domain-containing protein [Bryobacteraceae bacterium]|nr:DUF2309 domain-containing protein [Bryobacteraceae bacterium]